MTDLSSGRRNGIGVEPAGEVLPKLPERVKSPSIESKP